MHHQFAFADVTQSMVVHVDSSQSSVFLVFASATWLTRASFQASPSLLGNPKVLTKPQSKRLGFSLFKVIFSLFSGETPRNPRRNTPRG
jgi:hypothetical protein